MNENNKASDKPLPRPSLWTIPASHRTRLDKTRLPRLEHCLSAKMGFRFIVGLLCLAPVFVDLVSFFKCRKRTTRPVLAYIRKRKKRVIDQVT